MRAAAVLLFAMLAACGVDSAQIEAAQNACAPFGGLESIPGQAGSDARVIAVCKDGTRMTTQTATPDPTP